MKIEMSEVNKNTLMSVYTLHCKRVTLGWVSSGGGGGGYIWCVRVVQTV